MSSVKDQGKIDESRIEIDSDDAVCNERGGAATSAGVRDNKGDSWSERAHQLGEKEVSLENQRSEGQENVIAAGHQERDGVGSGKSQLKLNEREAERER